MGVNKDKRIALGNNPLNQGIFSKTEASEQTNQESRINFLESTFLNSSEKEKINLRLSVELNDWLDELLKKGKRKHGQKIPKEVWVQAALEFFRALPVDWLEIDSLLSLRLMLESLESRIKN